MALGIAGLKSDELTAGPIELGPAEQLRLPEAVRPPGWISWRMALLLSAVLHAAPLGLVTVWPDRVDRVSAGEHVIEVEFVIAEAETKPVPVIEPSETPPDPMSEAPASAEAAASEAARKEVATDPDAFPILPEPPQPEPPAREDSVARDAVAASAPPPPVAIPERQAAASDEYRAVVARHLARFKRFPGQLPRHVRIASVTVSFAIAPDGQLAMAQIDVSSGLPAVDTEALGMIQRAVPFPVMTGTSAIQSFTIPVTYRIRE